MLSCRTPISCLCSSDKSGTHSNPERMFRQEALRRWPWNQDPKCCTSTLCCKRSLSRSKKMVKMFCFFFTKVFLITLSKQTRWSNVLWFFLKLHCFSERRPCDSRDHMRWMLISPSTVLYKQLVNDTGLKLLGSGITTASCHDVGKQPDSQTWLYTF